MKKALKVILALALILVVATPTVIADAKYKTYVLPEGLPTTPLTVLVKDHFPEPDHMVVGLVNNGVDTITPFGGILVFDKTIKYEESIAKVFGNNPVPEGTLAISLVVGKRVKLAIVTNIGSWEDFKEHVIGLPDEFANGDEPIEPIPTSLSTSTPVPVCENDKEKIVAPAMNILAELKALLPEDVVLAYEVVAHNVNSYRLKLTVGKTVIYQLTYGARPDNPSTFFVENVRKEGKGLWEGYIGGPKEAAEYILSKMGETKKK